MSEKRERQSNIELLRIIAMSMVIFLHYFNAEIGGGIVYVQKGTVNEVLLQILEAISICAVNVFVMISGYFLSGSNKRTLGKALVLLIQVILYRLLFYIIQCTFFSRVLTIKGIVVRLLPVNWFVVLYVVLYLISPFINIAFHRLKVESAKLTMTLFLVLFSIWPTVVDMIQQLAGTELMGLSTLGMYGSQRGYTITQFVVCYMIGMATHEFNLKALEIYGKKLEKRTLTVAFLAEVTLLTIWGYINPYTGREYCNPLVITEAWTLFMLFLKINIKKNMLINNLALSTFSVFLIHSYILPYLKTDLFVNTSIVALLFHIICSTIIIYLISYVVDRIYHKFIGSILISIEHMGYYSIE